MNSCIARQPIFNRDKTVFGYELLYREKGTEAYTGIDGDKATLNVMKDSFLSVGMETLAGNKKAFVNFTERLITEEIASLFSNEHMVIELLETIEPSNEVVAACKKLKNAGYPIVLDDFVLREDYEPLILLADIIKLDFLNTSMKENETIIKKYGNMGIKFLAEKIETLEDFNLAIDLGCTYFQGYFFAKPEVLPSRTISPYKLSYIRLINAMYDNEPDFNEIAEIIEHDVSFSYEVLKLVNSAAFYKRNTIHSIKQAIVFMGIEGIRKWVYLAVSKKVAGNNKPNEIINYSMIRLKFMEQMADRLGEKQRRSEYLTVGMLSLMDALMDMEMATILKDIHLSEDIKNTLLGNNPEDKMSIAYQLILKYERANMDELAHACSLLQLDIQEVSQMYYDALDWLNSILDSSY